VFAVVLLACYFSNFNTMLRSDTKHVSVMNFDELARQDVIDYGTVEGGSTFNFFKVRVALKRNRTNVFLSKRQSMYKNAKLSIPAHISLHFLP
jgi:hypothetical protein